jgi:hypothetical protein
LSKTSATLTAAAPIHWWRPILNTTNFERDPDYQAVNRIRYLWRFAPFGDPPGRASATLAPAVTQLAVPSPFANQVNYIGALPSALGPGAYDLTLRVEFTLNAAIGHEVTRRVNLVA